MVEKDTPTEAQKRALVDRAKDRLLRHAELALKDPNVEAARRRLDQQETVNDAAD